MILNQKMMDQNPRKKLEQGLTMTTGNFVTFFLKLDMLLIKLQLNFSIKLNSDGCELCAKGFEDINVLREHLKSHTVTITEAARRVGCVICSEHFSTRWEMILHIKNDHPGEKPFKCTAIACEYATNDVRLLKEHKITHSSKV
jgi:Zinc-finger double-stranded RNA-binding